MFEIPPGEHIRVFDVGRCLDEVGRDDGCLHVHGRSCEFASELEHGPAVGTT